MTTLPVYYTGAYQTKQQQAGIPGGASVFDALANPPATGVTAEEASLATAEALGVEQPNANLIGLKTANRDYIRDFYDNGSILRTTAGGGPTTEVL
jgi:hypothetical protein